jgi:gliding motility-associated-like protein
LGESITIEGTSLTGGTVTWDGGLTNGVPFTPLTPGVITYTSTSSSGSDCDFSVDITVNDLPSVTAAVDDADICLGESATFTGGGADTYAWDLGVADGVAFTPPTAGIVTHTVTGTNTTTGCENTATVDLEVFDLPTVTANVDDAEICLGESVTFTGGGADTYVWDLGVTDGAPFTPLTAGTFTHTVTGTNTTTGCENTATVTLEVVSAPSVTASVDNAEICIGESVTFTGGGADTYTWDMGVTDGVAFTPPAPGVFTFTVTGTTLSSGCENTATVNVDVNALPTVNANADDIEICFGQSVTLTGSGADTYIWDMGITNGVPYTPATIGSFTFNVTGTTAIGCVGTDDITIEVIECEDVVAAFSEFNSLCVGDCITFTDQSTGTIESWEWDFGGASEPTTSSLQNPAVCFNTVGTYDITLTVTNVNGTTAATTSSITINPSPTLTAYNDTIIDIGGNADLIAVSSSTGTITWEPNRDVACDNCFITTASPQDSTTFTATLIDENGCKAEASMFVLVNYIEAIGVPTGFSPNNDGENDILFVKGYGIKSMQLSVYNRYGELVFQSNDQNIGWDGTFQNKDQNPGVFTWVLQYNLISDRKGLMKGNTTLVR